MSIASRDAHLHYDKKGLGKSTARGFARSRTMTKSGSDRGRSSGALGAVLNEVDFPVETMRAVAAVGRAAGLIGHIREEMENPIVPSVVEFINNIEYRDPD